VKLLPKQDGKFKHSNSFVAHCKTDTARHIQQVVQDSGRTQLPGRYKNRPPLREPEPSDLDEPLASIPEGKGGGSTRGGGGGGNCLPTNPGNAGGGGEPSDNDNNNNEDPPRRTPRRGTTPLEDNRWLFSDPPEPENNVTA
jgi:hypothetical protein